VARFSSLHIMTPLGTASKHPSDSAAKQDANLDAAKVFFKNP
jgi:hypothetical protein